jgi:hypothetical protein
MSAQTNLNQSSDRVQLKQLCIRLLVAEQTIEVGFDTEIYRPQLLQSQEADIAYHRLKTSHSNSIMGNICCRFLAGNRMEIFESRYTLIIAKIRIGTGPPLYRQGGSKKTKVGIPPVSIARFRCWSISPSKHLAKVM